MAKLFQSGGGGGGGITAFVAESIAAGGTISSLTSGQQYRPIQSTGGAVSASLTPFGSFTWETGTQITLKGQSATDTVQLTHNDAQYGAILNGNMVLGLNDVITLIYDSTLERWIEVGRNN